MENDLGQKLALFRSVIRYFIRVKAIVTFNFQTPSEVLEFLNSIIMSSFLLNDYCKCSYRQCLVESQGFLFSSSSRCKTLPPAAQNSECLIVNPDFIVWALVPFVVRSIDD